MTHKHLSSLVVAGFLGAAASFSPAAISYQYVAGSPTYSTGANGSVSVPISLVETFTGGDTSLIASESGLSGAGFSVTQAGNTSGTAATLSAITGDAAFNFQPNKNVTATSASLLEGILFVSPVTGTATAATTRTVSLGTVTIATGASAAVTTFNIGLYNTTGMNTVTSAHSYNLDVSNNGGTPPPQYSGATGSSFTVTTVVPEPASLIGLGGMALLLRRRTR